MEGEISCPIIPTIQGICVCDLLTISSYDILLFHSSVATIIGRRAKETDQAEKLRCLVQEVVGWSHSIPRMHADSLTNQLVCLSTINYLACKLNIPCAISYSITWGLFVSSTFCNDLTKGLIFIKKMHFTWNVCYNCLYIYYPQLFSIQEEFKQDRLINVLRPLRHKKSLLRLVYHSNRHC